MDIREIIRPKNIKPETGLSLATIRRLEIAGKFPRRRRIGLQGVGWLRSEVQNWRESQEKVFVTSNGQKVGSKLAA